LPVIALIRTAWQSYRQHFPQLMRVVALPALAHAVTLYIWYHSTERDKLLVVLLWLTQAFLLTLAAISCHRIILLGSESVPRLGASGTAARDSRFIATAAALYGLTLLTLQLASTAVFLPLGLIGFDLVGASSDLTQLLVYLATLPALYVVSRLSLCLPAVAVDRPLGPKHAWRLTRGDGLRLLVLIGLLPWLLKFSQRHLAWMFPTAADAIVVGNLLLWILLPFEVAVLSLCYQRLSRRSA
jgi:hypothetical protein